MLVADHNMTHVLGVEGVHVLLGVDGGNHRAVVQSLGEGQLAQDAVDVLALVEFLYHRQQFLLGGGGRQIDLLTVEAHLFAGFLLIAHVGLAGGIVAHQNHRQTGGDTRFFQCRRLCGDFGAEGGGDLFTVNPLCHRYPPRCFQPVLLEFLPRHGLGFLPRCPLRRSHRRPR